MCRILCLCLLSSLLVATSGAAQDEGAVKVDLPNPWKVGDRFRVEVTREKARQPGVKGTVIADVEFKKKTDSGWVVWWTWGNTGIKGAGPQANNPIVKKLMNVTNGLRLEMATDRSGLPEKLLNTEAVVVFYSKMIDTIVEELDELLGEASPAVKKQIMDSLQPALAPLKDPATVEASALDDPSLFFMVCAGSFEKGRKTEYEVEIPNPFGKTPFPGRGSFELGGLEPAKARATVLWKQTIDRGKAEKAFKEVMQTLFAAAGAREEAARAEIADVVKGMKIEDSATFVMDVATGRPATISHQRTVNLGNRNQVDKKAMKMLPALKKKP